jgi:hypothetical protein
MILDDTAWRVLIVSLPGSQAAPRMRLWRAIKALGAASLRDGVYLLPDGDAAAAAFAEQATRVGAAGGTAHVLQVAPMAGEGQQRYRDFFDRGEGYAALSAGIDTLRRRLPRLAEQVARRAAVQLRRDFTALAAIDFFPGAARERVAGELAALEQQLAQRFAPGEPRAADGDVPRLAIADYQGRVWATRARPWVDRLASAWLIRRFVDPGARIRWLQRIADRPREALGFDFDGARFTHLGGRVTFEVLVESFGLERDTALARIAALVHYLDVGGAPVPEAEGIEALLAGARKRHADDDALLAEAAAVFDSLYAAFQHGFHDGERRNG